MSMTRLTDEQIDNVVHDVRQALGGKAWYRHFADRIAALAVQEGERENDYWRTDAEEKSDRIASLTAQLAERENVLTAVMENRAEVEAQLAAVKEERDISRSLYRDMYEHYQRELATLRAKLATAKRAGGTE